MSLELLLSYSYSINGHSLVEDVCARQVNYFSLQKDALGVAHHLAIGSRITTGGR